MFSKRSKTESNGMRPKMHPGYNKILNQIVIKSSNVNNFERRLHQQKQKYIYLACLLNKNNVPKNNVKRILEVTNVLNIVNMYFLNIRA